MQSSYWRRRRTWVLLGAAADPNRPNSFRLTPLHVAAQYGHTDIVEVLLGAAADPNLPPNLPSYLRTPLHVAAEYGHTDIVQVLLGAAADPNRSNNQQQTPLHACGCTEWAHRHSTASTEAGKGCKGPCTPRFSTGRSNESHPGIWMAVADGNTPMGADIMLSWCSFIEETGVRLVNG